MVIADSAVMSFPLMAPILEKILLFSYFPKEIPPEIHWLTTTISVPLFLICRRVSSVFSLLKIVPGTSLFEDFESYTATSIVPDCWARIVPSGSQTITSTSPASGIRNIYQYASASNTPSVVILPEFSNVNANTHRLRFKARVATATGNLQVGYVTSTTDASTFVSIESLSIPNTSYGVDYIVDVPATVPATARLAIRNTNDAKAYYWDDIYWEPKNSLSVAEVSSKKKVSVYPNPFNDVLFVSDTENIKTIKITDVSGRVLKVIDNPTKGINLNSLNTGLYLVTMYLKDGSVNTVKAIKK